MGYTSIDMAIIDKIIVPDSWTQGSDPQRFLESLPVKDK
jgi:hypothetical protein